MKEELKPIPVTNINGDSLAGDQVILVNQPSLDHQKRHEAIENFRVQRLTDFTNALNIKWRITITYQEGRHGAAIYSNPSQKTHEILLPKKADFNVDEYLPDIAHELCHARFSEELDSIYSTVRFPKKYGDLNQNTKEYKDFVVKARMMEVSQAWVDVWINELRHNLWPELTTEDDDGVMLSLSRLNDSGQLLNAWSDGYAVAVAMILAEQKRNKSRQHQIGFLMQTLGSEWKKVKKLRDLFEELPLFTKGGTEFTERAKKDGLKEFEKVAREVAKIFNYPILPTIKKEVINSGETFNVWDFK